MIKAVVGYSQQGNLHAQRNCESDATQDPPNFGEALQ